MQSTLSGRFDTGARLHEEYNPLSWFQQHTYLGSFLMHHAHVLLGPSPGTLYSEASSSQMPET